MKFRTVTERIGELLGPVDWSYDFLSHFSGYSGDKEAHCLKAVDRLRKIVDEPLRYEVTTDGGWPRFGWSDVIDVGMYDGWPYWRPVPSVCKRSPLGGCEWHAFHCITNIADKQTGETF